MSKTAAQTNLERLAVDPMLFFKSLTIPAAGGPQPFGNLMADFQAEWFATIAPSLIDLAHRRVAKLRRFWNERVKGASKDSDIGLCLLWLLVFSKLPLRIECGARDRDQIDELRGAMRDVVKLNLWIEGTAASPWIKVERNRISNVRTAAECKFLTSDSTGAHGSRPDVIVMNELSHMDGDGLPLTMSDNAAKIRHCLTIIGTNSGWLNSFQDRWRRHAQRSTEWNFHTHKERPPWISEADEIEARTRNSTSRFARLFRGIWASLLGDALSDADIEAAFDNDIGAETIRDPQCGYVAGLDMSTKNDHTGFVVLASDARTQTIRLVDARRWIPKHGQEINHAAVHAYVLASYQKFRFSLWHDGWQTDYLVQSLQRDGIHCEKKIASGHAANEIATAVLDAFHQRVLVLYDDAGLKDDVRKLNIIDTPQGYTLKAARDKDGHADVAFSLAVCLPAAFAKLRRSTGTIIFTRTPDANRSDNLRGWARQNF